ncbi:MAG: CHAT domain-containing protein [Armatimonadetes bacterium]|nr:CHAT domain-containing protein [Armatimonadota bacterium]
MEHAKSRALIDMLGNMKIHPRRGMDPTLIEKLEEFKKKLKDLRQELESPKEDSGRSRSVREEFRAVRTALSDFLQQVELRTPEDALMALKQVPPFSATDLKKLTQNSAWSGTVFLEFFLGTKESYGFVSRDGTFRTFRIPAGDQEIRKRVSSLRDKIKGKSPDWKEDSAALYGILIKPVEKEMAGASRLAVIPNGPLHYLPFSPLLDGAGKLLIEKIPLFTLPSATVARFVQSGGDKKSDEMLLLANPDGSLPFAEAEAAAINQATKLRPRILLKNQATEGTVKKLTSSAGYVHFATHGILDGGQPLYSALVLAPDQKEDGRLEMQEIFNELDLKHTRLVTLSACNTAVGPETGGDEIAGLSRAFMYAGAPSVLASLWAVDDYSTSRLMTEFYRNLSGSDKAQALQKAQLAVYSEEKVSHPFYWAAFELIGSFR